MTSIRDIAKLANVSRGTVDRVLNNRGGVKKETADRVLSVAEALNYKPNIAAQMLAVYDKNIRIGFVISFLADFAHISDAVHRKAADSISYGFSVELVQVRSTREDDIIHAVDELINRGITGLAILAPEHLPLLEEHLQQLTKNGVAIVLLFMDMPDSGRIALVDADHIKVGIAAASAARLMLRRAASVLVIGDDFSLDHQQKLIRSFTQTITEFAPEIQVLPPLEFSQDIIDSYTAAKEFLKNQKTPDAVFLIGLQTMGVLRAIADSGLTSRMIVIEDLLASTCNPLRTDIVDLTFHLSIDYIIGKATSILYDKIALGVSPKKEFNYAPCLTATKELPLGTVEK